MTLFNYGGCDTCNKNKCNNKVLLSNVLPVNVCNKIGDYTDDCGRCKIMKDKEQKYNDKYIDINKSYTKTEIQLQFFRYYKRPFLVDASTWCDGGKEFKDEIDRIFDKPKVKDKYKSNRIKLQAIKSYCKSRMSRIQVMAWHYHDLNMFKKQFDDTYAYPYNTYTFRNKEYEIKDMIKNFFIEYVDDLIGNDKVYCNMDEIKEYLDKLFN